MLSRLFPICKNLLRYTNNTAASFSRLWMLNHKAKNISSITNPSRVNRSIRKNCHSCFPLMDICGKTAIITGAANGMGYSITQYLLANRAKVLMVDIDGEMGSKAANCLAETYGRGCVDFYHGDVACEAHQQAYFRRCYDCFGQVNIVINNASVWDETNWTNAVEINLKAVMNSMLLSFQYMRGGLIINISSTLAFKPNAACPIFSGTKRSVLGLTRSLSDSFYYQKYNNRICTLCPGITYTNHLESARQHLCTNELQEEFDRILAYEYKQKPEAVGAAVVHLIHQAPHGSTWVVENGDLYRIDFPHYKCYCVPKTLHVVCDK